MSAADILGAAVDAIWQGVLLCAVVEMGVRLIARRNAATLAAIWTAALVACIGLTTLDVVARHEPTITWAVAKISRTTNVASTFESTAVHEMPAGASTSVRAVDTPTLFEQISDLARRAAFPIVLGALLIAAARCCVFALEIRATLRARRVATRIEPPLADLPATMRAYGFASSATATTPHVLGLGRPLIVLPATLLAEPRERIRGVVLHELTHVCRYDDVRGVIEAALVALLWWNPGMRFALGRSARFRERICDDAAVAATRDDLGYATILAEIARGASLPLSAVPCFSSRHTVLERVRAILDASIDRSPRPNRKLVAAAVAVTALVVVSTTRLHVPVSAAPLATPFAAPVSEPQSGDHAIDVELHVHSEGAPEIPTTIRGKWTLERCADPRYLRLGIEFAAQSADGYENWNEIACVPATEFRGLSKGTIPTGDAAFSVVRAAGAFEATGHVENQAGAGTYVFVPSAAFIERVRGLGNGTPTLDQLFALTIADFQSVELDELAAHGYAAPTPNELARLAVIDADPTFVLTAVKLPATEKTVSQISRLAEVGFRTDEIDAVEGFGYHPTLEQFIRLAEAGIRPPWIKRLRAGGYTDTNVDDLIDLREQG
jgi:beta-lactamase regulating signal transducer with metallopeptidase domain